MPDDVSGAVQRSELERRLEQVQLIWRQAFEAIERRMKERSEQFRREINERFEQASRERSEDIARQLGAFAEAQRIERAQENKVLAEDRRAEDKPLEEARKEERRLEHLDLLANIRATTQPVETQVADHEKRIVRLEARPAKRPAPKRKPK